MGKERKRRDSGDSLRWYEVVTCCCKWRAECKSCVATTFVYFVPIIFLLCFTATCVTIGVIWRNDCCYKKILPYWVIVSSVTSYPLLTFIKAVKERYLGVTCWRVVFLTYYVMFATWTVIGSVWIYDTWSSVDVDCIWLGSDGDCDNVSDVSCCNVYLRTFAFAVTFVHWLLLALATIPLVYIMSKVCCCCEDGAIDPLKPGVGLEEYPYAK